jgi:hypothetical protein
MNDQDWRVDKIGLNRVAGVQKKKGILQGAVVSQVGITR